MEKSFSSWRAGVDSSDGDSDSDVVEPSIGNIIVPESDSDNSIFNTDVSKSIANISTKTVAESDVDESICTNRSSKSNFPPDIFDKSTDSHEATSIFSKSTDSGKNNSITYTTQSSHGVITPRKKRMNVIESSSDEEENTDCKPRNESPADFVSLSKDHSDASKVDSLIDLTLPNCGNSNRPKSNFSRQSINQSGEGKLTKNVITIDSDSEDDSYVNNIKNDGSTSYEYSNAKQAVPVKTSPLVAHSHDNIKSLHENKPPQTKDDNNIYSRSESLKAEESKLKLQVAEAMKDIESAKNTLKTANLFALPDKGVRLQMFLKKKESHLRDLRYQQSTLANELIKLQMMSKSKPTNQPLKQDKHQPEQKIFKLPTSTTDINAMGKKALETHRTQQALTGDALRILHHSLKNRPSEETMSDDPSNLRVKLMPHQKHALAWLLWRESEKPYGGILADDMGLGKTLTMISLILMSNEKENNEDEESDDEDAVEHTHTWLSSQRSKLIRGKTLVVCPASLLGQWEGEAYKRLEPGTLNVLVHHGNNREKKARRLARQDLVITTYSIVGRYDAENPLFEIRWDRIILDEAHQIRNHKTKMAQGVFMLKGRNRWALTGTPVHNKELDLYSLIRFLRCKPFDDLNVWKRWVDNKDAAGKQRLSTIMNAIMLRRTKEGLQTKGELTTLTDKQYHSIHITLDKEEQESYEKLLLLSKTLFATFLHQKAEKENALTGLPVASNSRQHLANAENPFENHPHLARLHKQMKALANIQSHHVLVLILRLRQFCCHPSLIKSMLQKEEVGDGIEDNDGLDLDLMDKLTRMSIVPDNGENPKNENVDTGLSLENPLFDESRISSKMRRILETVEDIMKTEDKVIVVSQWTSLLNLFEGVLKSRHIKTCKLTGSVAIKDRPQIVEKFNMKGHGPRVMLLSLTAGGVGLNLVGGNHLLLLDLHWNPQLESQACDRIYRIGQKKTCQIYKFISSDTIEENILKLQEKKLEIADGVLTGANAKHSSKLTLDDLKLLFS